jgi:hypothetical protein
LRPVDEFQGAFNRKRRITNKSGFKGVDKHKATGKWRVRIQEHGTMHNVGLCIELHDAAQVYANMAFMLHKEYVRGEHHEQPE